MGKQKSRKTGRDKEGALEKKVGDGGSVLVNRGGSILISLEGKKRRNIRRGRPARPPVLLFLAGIFQTKKVEEIGNAEYQIGSQEVVLA